MFLIQVGRVPERERTEGRNQFFEITQVNQARKRAWNRLHIKRLEWVETHAGVSISIESSAV